MAKREQEVSKELINEAMRHPDVVSHLEVVARRVVSRAQGIASAENVKMRFWIESSVRPGAKSKISGTERPQSMVYGDNEGQEWGSKDMSRLRILGRAGEQA